MKKKSILKEKDVIIEELFESFNWSKVALVMEILDYQWDFGRFKNKRPTIPEMKEVARNILERVYDGENYLIGLGGFVASVHSGVLQLQFILADKYSHLEYSDEEMNPYE